MSKENLLKTLDGITELPTLPTIYTRINKLLRSSDSRASEIARLIESDQSISTKILRLVNSPFFGFSRKITRIGHAVVLLGFNSVRSAVLSISVLESFGSDSPGDFDRKQFWKHSIATGTIAKLLSRELKICDEEDAFAAGIIHDMGKLVLDQYFPERFSETLTLAEAEKCSAREAERQILGTDHGEIGEYLSERWSLPLILVEPVALHHTPGVLRSNPQMVSLIHISDALAHLFGLGAGKNLVRPRVESAALEELNIDAERVKGLVDKIRGMLDKSNVLLHQ